MDRRGLVKLNCPPGFIPHRFQPIINLSSHECERTPSNSPPANGLASQSFQHLPPQQQVPPTQSQSQHPPQQQSQREKGAECLPMVCTTSEPLTTYSSWQEFPFVGTIAIAITITIPSLWTCPPRDGHRCQRIVPLWWSSAQICTQRSYPLLSCKRAVRYLVHVSSMPACSSVASS
jgi:hypothetical protein